MQGLITLDFGNSHPHAGLFQKTAENWKLIKIVPWKELPIYLEQLEMTPSNSTMVLCEVKNRDEELVGLQHQGFLITRVKDYWKGNRFAGMPVHYAKSLGEDRLIQAFYAYKKLKENTLIIDSGTFVTLDIVTQNGFQGGYILPGVESYFPVFQKGELLKNIELNKSISLSLPQSTEEAMRDSYVAFAALAQNLVKDFEIQKIILTGGSYKIWRSMFNGLKLSADVQEDPDLIHSALQFWMTTQIEIL